MAPRRSHTKSRQGCDTCRDRRVKCDEKGPPCSNCAARELVCTYIKSKMQRRPHSDPKEATSTPEATSISAASLVSRGSIRKRELQLLHRYSTSTYQSLKRIFDVPDNAWKLFVVEQALEHDFLLSGLFALAASHAASESTAANHGYHLITAEYLELALTEFRPLLNTTPGENLYAMYAFGVVLCTTLFSQLEASAALSWSELLDKLDGIYDCLNGVKEILTAGSKELHASPFGPILERLEAKHDVLANQKLPDISTELKRLVMGSPNVRKLPGHQEICYSTLVDNLAACWSHSAYVIDWYTNAGKAFRINLRQGGTMEKLLLAYWGAALGTLRTYWFIGDLGRTIARMAIEQIGPVDDQTWLCISWVKDQLGLNNVRI